MAGAAAATAASASAAALRAGIAAEAAVGSSAAAAAADAVAWHQGAADSSAAAPGTQLAPAGRAAAAAVADRQALRLLSWAQPRQTAAYHCWMASVPAGEAAPLACTPQCSASCPARQHVVSGWCAMCQQLLHPRVTVVIASPSYRDHPACNDLTRKNLLSDSIPHLLPLQ